MQAIVVGGARERSPCTSTGYKPSSKLVAYLRTDEHRHRPSRANDPEIDKYGLLPGSHTGPTPTTGGGRSSAPTAPTPGPPVWTTLALTLYADGSTGHELVGATSFPRHWIYDADGQLAGKSALIDFKTWYRTATLGRSPWRSHDNAVLAAAAETPLERHLSQVIMHGGLGPTPKPAKVKAGTTIIAEGDAADDIVLLLDGLVQVEANGTELARLGPGSVFGERASVEQGRRTATVRAVTDCRIVSYLAADLPARDLRELAAGHYREAR
jgi:hypothetical protein